MKLLVTGGCGFIGANFITYWLSTYPEDTITNIDALTYSGNPANLDQVSSNPNYMFVQGSICDTDLVENSMHNIDVVVNFAAESHVDRSIDRPTPFVRTNVEGTLILLEAARNHGNIRFHQISTDEVYGSLPLNKPNLKFTEDMRYEPRSVYAASKASAEHLVNAYFHTHKLPITVSNCSNNYGPYQFPEKLIPLIITRAINNEKIPLYGNGKQVRDWIHVIDHCRAIDLIIHKGTIGETYLVGGENEQSNSTIMHLILKQLKKPNTLIVHVGDRKGHDARYGIDMTKIKKELGFKLSKDFETGLAETVDWYVTHEEWWKPLKSEADKIAETYLNSK